MKYDTHMVQPDSYLPEKWIRFLSFLYHSNLPLITIFNVLMNDSVLFNPLWFNPSLFMCLSSLLYMLIPVIINIIALNWLTLEHPSINIQ